MIADSECRIHGVLLENQRRGVFTTHCHYGIIAQGQSSFQKNDLFVGKVPRRVVVGLVRNDAYLGYKAPNPFNFQLFNLKSLKLLVNGEE